MLSSLFSFYLFTMDIRQALLEEHSKKQMMSIAGYIGDDKKRFSELMKLFLGNEYRLTQRAAGVVNICATMYPDLLNGWLEKIIRNLTHSGLPDAVKRNTLRILQFRDVPSKLQGFVAESCFHFLQSSSEPVAVKVFSMTVLANLCKSEPDLQQELKLIIEKQAVHGSPGYLARSRRILKELGRKPIP